MFDYCVIVKNEIGLLRKHLDSLFKYENVDFPIHIIVVGDTVKENILDSFSDIGMIHCIPEYPKKTCGGERFSRSPACYENSYANDWVMNNCGDNEWKILIHPDTVYIGSFLNVVREKMKDPCVGAIGGIALGFMATRREAFNSCDIGFASLMGLQVFPQPGDPGTLCLRGCPDPRPVGLGKPKHINGLDVGELFVIDLCARGWTYEIFHGEIGSLLNHSGHGSNY